MAKWRASRLTGFQFRVWLAEFKWGVLAAREARKACLLFSFFSGKRAPFTKREFIALT